MELQLSVTTSPPVHLLIQTDEVWTDSIPEASQINISLLAGDEL